MRYSIKAIVVVGGMFLAPASACAEPESPSDIPALAAAADIIVVGRYAEGYVGSDGFLSRSIRVDAFIKGIGPHDSALLNLGTQNFGRKAPPRYGVFFFRNSAGHLESLLPNFSRVVAAPKDFEPTALPSTPVDALAAVIASTFRVPVGSAGRNDFGLDEVGLMVPSVLRRTNSTDEGTQLSAASTVRLAEGVYMEAHGALLSIPNEIKQPWLRQIVDNNPPSIGRLWAYLSLIRGHDYSRINAEIPYLLRPLGAAELTNSMLRVAFTDRALPQSYAPFFITIMHSTSGLIREAALGQLERMDAPALSNVIPTALRDPDPAVRELAIEDICERTQVCGDKSPQDEDNPNDMHHLGSIYASWRAANRR